MTSTDASPGTQAETPRAHAVEMNLEVPGPDPQGRSYQTYASFSDPDGNGWLLQEIRTRLPGRAWTD